MSKINWDVYARRRRIDLNKLIETQGLESYSDYLMFCLTINVNPMPKEDFPLSNTKSEASSVAKSTTVKAPPAKTKAPAKKVVKAPAKPEPVEEDRWGIKKTKTSTKKSTKKTGK